MRNAIPLMLLVAFATTGTVQADTLIMEGIDQARPTAPERPSRGMSMAAVSSKWGNPDKKGGPVGVPPITRWDYGDFVVFFEYDHVIHAVTKRS